MPNLILFNKMESLKLCKVFGNPAKSDFRVDITLGHCQ